MTDEWPVAASADELLADATERVPVRTGDAKSGSSFERVVIGGERYFAKTVSHSTDWIMRVCEDHVCWPLKVWRSGLLARVPPEIDHCLVGAAGLPPDGATFLMRDVGLWLVPEGDETLPLEMHLAFMDGMAALAAAFWGWEDTIGVMPLENRYGMFTPWRLKRELQRGTAEAVPAIALQGWQRLRELDPATADLLLGLAVEPAPLVAALQTTPQTFVHGDWKAGNLGLHPDGRVIVIDWAYLGSAPCLQELLWYVALNAARLPQSKEDAIEAYRAALERRGIETGPWWERQLSLTTLGLAVEFGWEKALGSEDERAWWTARAWEGARLLDPGPGRPG